MKKILLVCMLLTAIVFSLAACGGKDNPPSNEGNNNETPVHTHSFGEWIIVKEATPTQNGLKTRVCECGENDTAEIIVDSSTLSYVEALDKIDAAFNEGFKQDYWKIKSLSGEKLTGEYAKMPNSNSFAYYSFSYYNGIDGKTTMKTWVIETESGFIHMTEASNSGKVSKDYYTLDNISPIYQALFDINNPNVALNLLTQCTCENVSVANIEGKKYFTFTNCPSGLDSIVVIIENNLPLTVILSQGTMEMSVVYSYMEEEFVIPDVQGFEEKH